MNEYLNDYPVGTDQKRRRDTFFCQLARCYLGEGESDNDGWIVVPEAMRAAGYNEFELKHFLERLIEDGWIEVKGRARDAPLDVRLTSAGKARAQVICKDASAVR